MIVMYEVIFGSQKTIRAKNFTENAMNLQKDW